MSEVFNRVGFVIIGLLPGFVAGVLYGAEMTGRGLDITRTKHTTTIAFSDTEASLVRWDNGLIFARCPPGFHFQDLGLFRHTGETHPWVRAACVPNDRSQ